MTLQTAKHHEKVEMFAIECGKLNGFHKNQVGAGLSVGGVDKGKYAMTTWQQRDGDGVGDKKDRKGMEGLTQGQT